MQHSWARQSIAHILAGQGMGAQALTHGLAADLVGLAQPELAESLWHRAQGLTPEPATPSVGAHNQLPIPGTQAELIAQIAPLIVDYPADTGLNLALLSMLVELWPHVASDERPLLRVRFFNGLMERASHVGTRAGMPREAVVTRAELKVWNRYMPTATGEGMTAANAHDLLAASNAQDAYTRFADLLIGGLNQVTVARILGSVALHLVEHRADPCGVLLHPLVGAIATERLASLAPPEVFAALLSQLAHQVWWAANQAGLAVRSTDEVETMDLAQAILMGHSDSVRQTARNLRLDDARWWAALAPGALHLAEGRPHQVRRAIAGVWVLALRSQGHLVAPEDALAVALLLADGRSE